MNVYSVIRICTCYCVALAIGVIVTDLLIVIDDFLGEYNARIQHVLGMPE